MKKLFVASALTLAAGAAVAGDGWYGSIGLDQKEKQHSASGEYHNVFSMTIGKKLSDGYSVEALIEDEQVRNNTTTPTAGKGAHEGLYQIRGNKDFDIGSMFTPYVGLALGMKSKVDGVNGGSLDFPFYRYDLGVKAKLSDAFSVRLGWRHRQAFSDTMDGQQTKWNTNETTLALGYKLTNVDTISVAYKIERAADSAGFGPSSEYNTKAITYTRAF